MKFLHDHQLRVFPELVIDGECVEVYLSEKRMSFKLLKGPYRGEETEYMDFRSGVSLFFKEVERIEDIRNRCLVEKLWVEESNGVGSLERFFNLFLWNVPHKLIVLVLKEDTSSL